VSANPEQLRHLAGQLRLVAAEVSHQDVATASALVGLARKLVERAELAEREAGAPFTCSAHDVDESAGVADQLGL
jgi:hypothetical protein